MNDLMTDSYLSNYEQRPTTIRSRRDMKASAPGEPRIIRSDGSKGRDPHDYEVDSESPTALQQLAQRVYDFTEEVSTLNSRFSYIKSRVYWLLDTVNGTRDGEGLLSRLSKLEVASDNQSENIKNAVNVATKAKEDVTSTLHGNLATNLENQKTFLNLTNRLGELEKLAALLEMKARQGGFENLAAALSQVKIQKDDADSSSGDIDDDTPATTPVNGLDAPVHLDTGMGMRPDVETVTVTRVPDFTSNEQHIHTSQLSNFASSSAVNGPLPPPTQFLRSDPGLGSGPGTRYGLQTSHFMPQAGLRTRGADTRAQDIIPVTEDKGRINREYSYNPDQISSSQEAGSYIDKRSNVMAFMDPQTVVPVTTKDDFAHLLQTTKGEPHYGATQYSETAMYPKPDSTFNTVLKGTARMDNIPVSEAGW